jgi:hypothetical protein
MHQKNFEGWKTDINNSNKILTPWEGGKEVKDSYNLCATKTHVRPAANSFRDLNIAA